MSYKHLNITERAELCRLRVIEKLSMSAIAKIMKLSKSTISRELKRNTEDMYKVYLPDTVQEKMRTRRAEGKGRFKSISSITVKEIKQRLCQYHSPEQLAGRMKHEGIAKVSYETIY